MFFYTGVFIVEMFFYAIVNKTCCAPDVELIAFVTYNLVNSFSQ